MIQMVKAYMCVFMLVLVGDVFYSGPLFIVWILIFRSI